MTQRKYLELPPNHDLQAGAWQFVKHSIGMLCRNWSDTIRSGTPAEEAIVALQTTPTLMLTELLSCMVADARRHKVLDSRALKEDVDLLWS